jgi:UMF1 family MFS transporter
MKRERTGWYFYDWANSAFYTTVVTTILGPYINGIAKQAAGPDGFVRPFGIPIDARSYWAYLVALSVFTQVLTLPLFGAVADSSRDKKRVLGLLAYTGAGATAAMFFVAGDRYLLGGTLFLIANLAFGASIVVYNSFLPQIAPPEERDAVSSKGWGIGYLGGGLLLALNLLLFAKAPDLGLSTAMAARIGLASAGLWWGAFTVLALLMMRSHPPHKPRRSGQPLVQAAVSQLAATFRELRRYPQALLFLIAFLIYNDGIQAVIALAGQFGHDELKIPMSTLTLAILMVQFLAFAGALLFNRISAVVGTKKAILLSLAIWTAVLVAIFGYVRTTAHFFAAAAGVALVLGGSQALSRSLYSLMIPRGREAEFFSLYEVSDKGTSWLAPLFFGLALQFTGSYRLAILSLIVFFVAGMLVLARVDVGRGAQDAEQV